MKKLVFIFLDVDGVLNNENYIVKCYNKHHKPMSMNHVPFDPKCLNNLMILVQQIQQLDYDVNIILSSTWRLNEIDYNIVDARLAEYGLSLNGKTSYIDGIRGMEIKDFLQDKCYTNFIILDDDIFDIQDYFPNNLVKTDFKTGLTKHNVKQALKIIKSKGV